MAVRNTYLEKKTPMEGSPFASIAADLQSRAQQDPGFAQRLLQMAAQYEPAVAGTNQLETMVNNVTPGTNDKEYNQRLFLNPNPQMQVNNVGYSNSYTPTNVPPPENFNVPSGPNSQSFESPLWQAAKQNLAPDTTKDKDPNKLDRKFTPQANFYNALLGPMSKPFNFDDRQKYMKSSEDEREKLQEKYKRDKG